MRERQGRLGEAFECARVAVAEAEGAGDARALALSLDVLNACLIRTGHPDQADHMDRVLALYEELGDEVQVAIALSNIAAVAFFASDWDKAAEYVVRSAEASTAGDIGSAAMSRYNLGEMRVNQGRLEEAVALIAPARRELESFGYRMLTAAAEMQLGPRQCLPRRPRRRIGPGPRRGGDLRRDRYAHRVTGGPCPPGRSPGLRWPVLRGAHRVGAGASARARRGGDAAPRSSSAWSSPSPPRRATRQPSGPVSTAFSSGRRGSMRPTRSWWSGPSWSDSASARPDPVDRTSSRAIWAWSCSPCSRPLEPAQRFTDQSIRPPQVSVIWVPVDVPTGT